MFQAQNVQQIRDQNCEVTCLLFTSNYATLRYGLFRTATYQFRRLQAAAAPAVTLNNYVRRFRWWSGQPYWVNGNNEVEVHPNGYVRMFQPAGGGAWFWAHADGTPVLGQDGAAVWDTNVIGL